MAVNTLMSCTGGLVQTGVVLREIAHSFASAQSRSCMYNLHLSGEFESLPASPNWFVSNVQLGAMLVMRIPTPLVTCLAVGWLNVW